MQSSELVLISMAFPSLFFRHDFTILHLSLFDDWNAAALHFQIWHLKYAKKKIKKIKNNNKLLAIQNSYWWLKCHATVQSTVFSSSFWDLGFHLICNFLPAAIVYLPIKKIYVGFWKQSLRWKIFFKNMILIDKKQCDFFSLFLCL